MVRWGGWGVGSVIGRSPVRGIRLVLEWEVTTAREPVIVLPKCSIFRDAGMQIKCQLGGEDMKHWQYEVLKSLNWEHRVCVCLVIVVAYSCSVLLRKYIPYPTYQACLGRYSRITWSVSHKLRRMQSSPSPMRFKPDRWEGHCLAGNYLFISRTLIFGIILWFWKRKKTAILIFTGRFFSNDVLLLGKWWDDI